MNTTSVLPRNRRRILLLVYGLALVYYVLKLCYYAYFASGFPDQNAHLSYLVYMARNPSLLPDFADIPVLRTMSSTWRGLPKMEIREGTVNYLGHPSLYYLLMNLTGSVRFLKSGKIVVDVLKLRLFNVGLSSVTVAFAYYLGYTRLKSSRPLVHALYAFAVATLPILGYVGASLNNDNLAFLGLVLLFAGILRYQENRLNFLTYLLIGVGFLLGAFSKLTTALIMLIMLAAVLLMSLVRDRSLKLVWNKYFLVALPFFIAFLVYELKIHQTYGVWQPTLNAIDHKYYLKTSFYVPKSERIVLTLPQFLGRFTGGIFHTWSSLYGHNEEINELMDNHLFGLVYWIPVFFTLGAGVWQCIRRKQADRFTLPVAASFLGTLVYHIYNNWANFLKNGYLGGVQARYYMALVVCFAFVFASHAPAFFEKTKTRRRLGAVFSVLLILCWLAGDGIRLVMSQGF